MILTTRQLIEALEKDFEKTSDKEAYKLCTKLHVIARQSFRGRISPDWRDNTVLRLRQQIMDWMRIRKPNLRSWELMEDVVNFTFPNARAIDKYALTIAYRRSCINHLKRIN